MVACEIGFDEVFGIVRRRIINFIRRKNGIQFAAKLRNISFESIPESNGFILLYFCQFLLD